MTITDEMIVLAWNAMKPSNCLRPIEAHEAAEMKAAIAAALEASPALSISDEIRADLVAAAGFLTGHGFMFGAKAVLQVIEAVDQAGAAASMRADGSSRETSLALCIMRLAWLVRRKEPESKAAAGAMDLLRRFDLLGSPLRNVPGHVPENPSTGAALEGVGTPGTPNEAKNVPSGSQRQQ